MEQFTINEDIRLAETLPAAIYRSPQWLEFTRQNLFPNSWQYMGCEADLPEKNSWLPSEYVEGFVQEPILLTRDKDHKLHCVSNVCTHRGNLLATEPGKGATLRCRYHGRCFRTNGTFKSMPGFEQALHFPSKADNLPQISLENWHGLLFTTLGAGQSLAAYLRPLTDRIAWLPLETLEACPTENLRFHLKANWILYCDNYLEGFHIPFVHPALDNAIGQQDYPVELFPKGVLQIGLAKEGEPCFSPPAGHPDHGKRIYAYYFWLFPNLMFNFYPWGLSFNQVIPLAQEQTLIRYFTFQFKGTSFQRAVNAIDQTELEDQEIVETTQRGIRSRLYQRGRYSPQHEKGVHHFHRMLAAYCAK
jgi:choline monooxygenase